MRSGLNFNFNEFRASWKGGGVGVVQRLGDKCHKWGEDGGLRALIPNSLLLGITGHPFVCPDMIGGGLSSDFGFRPQWWFDHELFVRWAQCSALMPMMQYSLSLWRLRNKDTARLCRAAFQTHVEFADYIVEYAKVAAKTGEPIARYMEYCFPHEGLAEAVQQFMLGDSYLVAPVVEKRKTEKEVFLPGGAWQNLSSGETTEGGMKLTIPVAPDELLIFKRV
jgi:alpha-glucosidase (family GH31 glycosyl hydrolase)